MKKAGALLAFFIDADNINSTYPDFLWISL